MWSGVERGSGCEIGVRLGMPGLESWRAAMNVFGGRRNKYRKAKLIPV